MSEFRVCPACGYGRGFHVALKGAAGDRARIALICPSCGASYDPGWEVSVRDGAAPDPGPSFSSREDAAR